MAKLRYLIGGFLLFCFFLTQHSYSQNPGLIFKTLNSRNGLSDDDIRYIFQDHEGFMWISSEGGLDKYDGRNFQRYYRQIADSSITALQNFTCIEEDSYNNLWIISDTNGLACMNRDTEKVVHYKHDSKNIKSLSTNHARCIFEDSRKNLWITTFGGGLCLFNRKDSSFIRYQKSENNNKGPGSNFLTHILEDPHGMLWISSIEGLLIRFNPVNEEFTNIKINNGLEYFYQYGLNPNLCVDSDNNIWYAIQQNLFKYDNKKGLVEQYNIKMIDGSSYVFTFITSILEMDSIHLLIATHNNGLYLFNKIDQSTVAYSHNISNPFGIGSDHLSSVCRSADGVIWIGSSDNGVSIYSKNSLRFPQLMNIIKPDYLEFSNNSAYSFCELPDGRILLGTENKGLFVFDEKDNSLVRFLPELQNCSIFNLFLDNSGQLWISTWLNGLYCYDVKTKKLKIVREFPVQTGSSKAINPAKILKDHQNRIWLGGITDGIMMYDYNTQTIRRFTYNAKDSNSLSNNFVFKIFEDSHGNIWVGTSNGLNRYNDKQKNFIRYWLKDEQGKNLRNLLIYDIIEDSEGKIWFGSHRTLHVFDHRTKSFIGYPHRFRGDYLTVTGIIEDDKHLLWLATNSGISMYNPVSGSYTDYGMIDGIHYLSFNPNAGLKTSKGFIYFGSRRGALVFDPSLIKDDTIRPPVYITSLSVNDIAVQMDSEQKLINKPIYKTDVIRLNYTQTTLAFRFAALNYANPEANQYAYMLEGFDKDWIQAGNSNRALYTNLPPGRYVFKVIGSNSHNYWNRQGDQMVIYIRSPFWRTYWFRIGLGLILLIVTLLAYYNRIKNLKRNKVKLEQIVKDRTLELNNANTALTDQHEKLMQQNEEISSQNELLSQMSDEILKQNRELELHRSNLQKLIEDRTRELEIALHKAEESDRLKSAFLANMSHEIRTPMNAIVGFANMLKDEEIDPEERKEFIEVINANSEILLVLIDDILDLSLIEANQLTIKKEIFGLNEILDHLYSSYSLMNKKAKLVVRLNNEEHKNDLKIYSDKIRIKQILSNLMNNAYKFTEEGFIELGLIRKEGQLVFYVKDTGIGIAENEVDKVFERFRKSSSSGKTLYRGTGLGLAISKALANLLQGSLGVESVSGKGSVFYLYLPESVITLTEVENDPIINQKNFSKLTNKNIMIVEDEQANYLYAKKLLAKLDVNVHWAANGIEAIGLVSSGIHFHVILMDIKMPVMDGYEATKKIKAHHQNQVIVALTAYARPEDKIHFMEAGFDEYLSKPIRPNDLLSVIRKYL